MPGQVTAPTRPGWGARAGHLTSLPWALLGNGFTDYKSTEETRFLRLLLGEMKCPKCSFLERV